MKVSRTTHVASSNPKRKTAAASKKRRPLARRTSAARKKTAAKSKGASMAHKHAKKRRAAPRRKATNPHRSHRRRYHAAPRRRASNPTRTIGKVGSFAAEGATALVALVAARQLPQLILGASNTSWIGYGANVVATLVAAFVAKKIGGERAQKAALIGGGCYTVSRMLTEQLSPIGQYLSLTGVGDAAAATNLGTIREAYWPTPTMFDRQGNPIIPHQITSAAQQGMQPLQQAAAGMAGISNRYAAY